MSLFEQRAKINAWQDWGWGVLSALGAIPWLQPAVAGSDLWWHLAAGREIWATGSVPDVDRFSWSAPGAEWINHEWLWEALLWPLYSLHPDAVAWLQLAVLAALFVLLQRVALRLCGSPAAATFATWGSAATASLFLDVRPYGWTLLLVALLLFLRRSRRGPWAWPALIAFWANLHAGFVFGLCAIGLDVLVDGTGRSLRAGALRVPQLRAGLVALAALALLLNPWGIRILEFPLAYLVGDSPYRQITEWLPTPFALDPRSYAGRYWWLAALAAAASVRAWRREPYLVLLAAVTFAMAWTSRRFVPLFAICAAPLLALALAETSRWLLRRVPAANSTAALVGVALVGALLCSFWWTDTRLLPDLLARWTRDDFFPRAALHYLREIGPPRRVLNLWNWGGYLMLHLPESQVFIDGRANTVYDDSLLHDYRAIATGSPGAAAVLARYPADVALVRVGSTFESALRAPRSGWRELYRDSDAVLLAPPHSPLLASGLPSPERVVGDQVQYRLALAKGVADRGDPLRAESMVDDILAEAPLFVLAYGLRAELAGRRGDADAIRRTMARALLAYPRRAPDIRQLEGRAWELAGYLPQALRAYERTLPEGPFAPGDRRRQLIRQVEERMARRLEEPPGE